MHTRRLGGPSGGDNLASTVVPQDSFPIDAIGCAMETDADPGNTRTPWIPRTCKRLVCAVSCEGDALGPCERTRERDAPAIDLT